MATKKMAPKAPVGETPVAPVAEEITLDQAKRILAKRGFTRLIQVTRDPRSGRIIDLILREA